MFSNAKQILTHLIEQYEHSVVSKQGSTKNIKQRFHINKKDVPEYFAIDGYQFRYELNSDLLVYEENGWIMLDYDRDVDEIKYVILNREYIDDIYDYLHIEPKYEKEQKLIALFQQYENTKLNPYVVDIIKRIRQYEPYQSLICDSFSQTQDLLCALHALLNLESEVTERVFSVRVLKNSKSFSKLSKKIIHILKRYFYADSEVEDDEILADFNIMKNPGYVSLKGKGTFTVKDTLVNLKDFRSEFLLSSNSICDIIFLDLPIKRVITIENLTSFYEAKIEDTLFIYLGGYHNQLRRSLLKKIYAVKPSIKYYHFGDIDVGGMQIYQHLNERTKIPFQPLCMNINTLNKYMKNTISLTVNDKKRLTRTQGMNHEFQDLIAYMLVQNIKLEQENVILTIDDIDEEVL